MAVCLANLHTAITAADEAVVREYLIQNYQADWGDRKSLIWGAAAISLLTKIIKTEIDRVIRFSL